MSEQKPTIELLDNGDVVLNKRGKSTVIATFDAEAGHLEFTSEKNDVDFRELAVRYIQEDESGTVSTGVVVKSFGVKGRRVDAKDEDLPPIPKTKDGLGDKSPKVVEWYFKHKPQEAYVRYGVKLDEKGKPILRHCKRKNIKWEEVYTDTKGNRLMEPAMDYVEYIDENEQGMVARRATHMTYLETDVIGGEE